MKTSLSLTVVLIVWAVLAVIAGACHLLAYLPPLGVQIAVVSLIVGFSLAVMRVRSLHDAVGQLSIRTLVAVHVVRFLGFYFLWLETQQRLPSEFAQRAGWGDVAVAAGAVALLLFRARTVPRSVFVAWNLFGIADLLLAVGTATWLNVTRPGSMNEVASLPLTMVPLFLVPVLIASHVQLIRRLVCGVLFVVPGRAAAEVR